MKIRTTKPESGNKFYNTVSKGGYSHCIVGYPTDKGCNVLANCVGYACGRFNEIIGSMKYPYLNCNAENFIERARQYGLEISDKPMLGGIMVWQKGNTLSGGDGAGHVAIVEKIIDNNTIYTSESGYGSSAFWNSTRSNTNGRWGIGSGYKFRGCIINPSIKDESPDELDKYTDEELAKMVWQGKFGNGEERKQKLGKRYNTVQNLVNQGIGKDNKQEESKPDILLMVKKTIRGDYGNGQARKNALGKYYDEVQNQVNLNYKYGTTNWNNVKLY